MSAAVFQPAIVQKHLNMSNHYQYSMSPVGQSVSCETRMGAAIVMRKLPRNTSREELRSMLLFAKDLKEADFIPNEKEENRGFLTAVAYFGTAGADNAERQIKFSWPGSHHRRHHGCITREVAQPTKHG
jgi:hypothetical protein